MEQEKLIWPEQIPQVTEHCTLRIFEVGAIRLEENAGRRSKEFIALQSSVLWTHYLKEATLN